MVLFDMGVLQACIWLFSPKADSYVCLDEIIKLRLGFEKASKGNNAHMASQEAYQSVIFWRFNRTFFNSYIPLFQCITKRKKKCRLYAVELKVMTCPSLILSYENSSQSYPKQNPICVSLKCFSFFV